MGDYIRGADWAALSALCFCIGVHKSDFRKVGEYFFILFYAMVCGFQVLFCNLRPVLDNG